MIKFVWRTDVHLSDRAPASRKDDWTETVLGKLRQTILVANKIKADAILDGGDFFHIKSPGRNSHELIRKVADLHAECACPVYANVGNHDCVYGDYAYIDQQPLGVLYSTGVFKRLYDEHEAVFTDDDGMKVRVIGIPYHGTKYDMERFYNIEKGDEDYLIVIAHVLASAKGGTMFENEDIVKYDDIAYLNVDAWLFGHWHKDQGVRTVNGAPFVNIGSLVRGALTQDSMTRKPCMAVLTITKEAGVKVQQVGLRVQDAEEVFDTERREQVEARTSTIDAFVASLRDRLVDSDKPTLESAVETMDLSDDVRETAILYLEKTA
jgi:DNA repair exonuclease SbcCD nuclease subunit